MQKIFLSPTHYILLDIIRTLTTEQNRLINDTNSFPNDKNFESKMDCLNFLNYYQRILTGGLEDSISQDTYDHVTNMVKDLEKAGFLNLSKDPIQVLPRKKTSTQVEQHIEAHEANEVQEILEVQEIIELQEPTKPEVIATMADPVGIPELGIIEEKPKKSRKKKAEV